MSGAGGRTMVKLRVAEALEGKQILFVPSGGKGGTLQTTNVNDLIARFAASAVQEARPLRPASASKKIPEDEAK
jgi:hypothetical protein